MKFKFNFSRENVKGSEKFEKIQYQMAMDRTNRETPKLYTLSENSQRMSFETDFNGCSSVPYPSVLHQKPLSSTPKTPRFHPLNSTPKTPQFHTSFSSTHPCVDLRGFCGTELEVELWSCGF